MLLPFPPDSISNNDMDQWDALRNILIKVVRSCSLPVGRCREDSREGDIALRHGGIHTLYNIHTIYHCVSQVKMNCFLSCFQISMEKEEKQNKTKHFAKHFPKPALIYCAQDTNWNSCYKCSDHLIKFRMVYKHSRVFL